MELLPYIMDLMDDDEEILMQLAEVLDGSFLEHVGGPLFAPHLFKPLERLCEVEESAVRDKVSSSSVFYFLIGGNQH
jgi:serine/threonine-protein phosphatase 2A regulatory subunit A